MARAVKVTDLGLLVFLGALWGTAFIFIILGLRSFSPVLFAALRFDIVALLMLAFVAARRRDRFLPRGRAQWAAVGIAAVFNVAGYHALLFWGEQFTTAGIGAIIVGLNPVLTTVFSRALLKDDRVGPAGYAGLGLGLLGIVVLASLKPGSLLDARGLGELAALGAVASWGLGSVLVKRAQHRMDVFAFIGWHSLLGALVLHAVSLATEGGGRAVFDFGGSVSLFYLAVLSSGIGFVVYFTLIERLGPIRVNTVSHIAGLFATVSGFHVLQETIELRALGAFGLIVSGFVLVQRPAKAQPPRPAPEVAAVQAEQP